MKSLIIFLLVVFIIGCSSNSTIVKTYQYNENDYIAALRSENNGLVESVLFQIVYQKLIGFETLSEKMLEEVIALEKNSASMKIREKAKIAIKFFEQYNRGLVSKVKSKFYENGKLFNVLADLLFIDQNSKIFVSEISRNSE